MDRMVQTASHWGVYNVTIDARGRIVGTSPFERDPHPSKLLEGLPELVQSGLRVRPTLHPGRVPAQSRRIARQPG